MSPTALDAMLRYLEHPALKTHSCEPIMRGLSCLLTTTLMVILLAGCQAHNYTQRGTAIGGLGGAGLGAAIGELTADEPLAGAAIGSAIGALSGSVMGSGLDDVVRRQQTAQAAAQAAYTQPVGATVDEIISMTNAGLADPIINRHIRTHGFAGPLDAGDLIALRQQGVSDGVIEQLQSTSRPSLATHRVAQTQHVVEGPPLAVPPQVIIEERYHPMPVPVYPRRMRRYPPRRRGPPGMSWGIAFSN